MKSLIFAALVFASAPVLATDDQETTRAAQVAVSVAEQIRIAHHGDYTDLTQPRETVALPWGSLIAYSGPYPDTHSYKNFGLHIDGLPAGEDPTCERFVLALGSAFQDVWMAGAGPNDLGGTVYAHGHVDRAALKHACRAHEHVGIDLITH